MPDSLQKTVENQARSPLFTREVSAKLGPEIGESTFQIEIVDIDDSQRLRPIDPLFAQAIAASMAKDGLLQPIDVCQLPGQSGYKLVAGGHRLAAARLNGWTHIDAFIRSNNALQRRGREIAENLFKADLSPLDRAAFVADLYAVEKARAGIADNADARTHSANTRWQKALKNEAVDAMDKMSSAYGLNDAVAAKLGLHTKAVQRDLLLFKRLPADLVARVRALAIADNASALRKLASLDPAAQGKAVTLIEAGKAKGVNDALAIIEKRSAPDAEKKRLSTFIGTFNRMGKREKLAALAMLEPHLPTGAKLLLKAGSRDELTPAETKFNKEIMAVVRGEAPEADPDAVVDIEDMIAATEERAQ